MRLDVQKKSYCLDFDESLSIFVGFDKIGSYPEFFQKTNKKYDLQYYDTSGRLVFVRFLEKIEDTKKSFQNYLSFKPGSI